MIVQPQKKVNLFTLRIFQFVLLFGLFSNFSYSQSTSNWTNINLDQNPSSGNNYAGGSGRVNTVVVDPDNNDIIYVGTPAGGLWRSSTGGNSWEPLTDDIPSLGVSAIAIDYNSPRDNRTIYILTGDSEGGLTVSTGVLKSIDNGASWKPTGLIWDVQENKNGNELVIDPTNSNVLMAGDRGGLYRTEDAGKTWKRVLAAQTIFDIKFKPGNATTVYASGRDEFFKSTNGGVKWQRIRGARGSGRTAIAVSPERENVVYLMFGFHNPSSKTFSGLYRSTDSGETFELRFNDRLIREGSARFSNLGLAAAPDNADEVSVGSARSLWKSKDGGKTWENNASLQGESASQSILGGINSIAYFGDTAYTVTDAGIYKTKNNAQDWQNISKGLSIAQVNRIGLDPTNANRFVTGSADNGSNIYEDGTYRNWNGNGANGYESSIDPANPQRIYGNTADGGVIRSDDGGKTVKTITPKDGNGTPLRSTSPSFILDPKNSDILYAVYGGNVYKSEDRGDSWVNFTKGTIGSERNSHIAIAPSDTKYMYVSKLTNAIYYSHDGGNSWKRNDIFDADPVFLTYIAVNPDNPKMVWVTIGENEEGKKVYKSDDGGVTFTNISGTLPNVSVNCIVYEKGSDDGIYIGTDTGVFYKNNKLSDWKKYSDNLPNTVVTELEIQYLSNKIYAATSGRGVWVSDVYPSDNTTNIAPTVVMTSPAEGDTFTPGSTITLSSTASDADGKVVRVTWFRNGIRIRSDSGSPYSKPWENVPAGTYAITATAEDDKGAITTSDPVTITVTSDTNIVPTVVMTSPAEGDTFEGGFGSAITLSSTASDADGTVVRVTWFQNGKRIRSDSGAPFSKPWENVAPGTYTITAIAEDNNGKTTTSEPVNITVTNRSFAICNNSVESIFASIPFDDVAEQGDFEAEYKVFPRSDNMDGVVGLSNGNADGYSDLAILVRLNKKGFFDVRNGDSYMSTAAVRYKANVSQIVRIKGNMDTKTYSVFVRPSPSSKEVQIADNYKFRTEQVNIAKLDTWIYVSGQGTLKFCITRDFLGSSSKNGVTITNNIKEKIGSIENFSLGLAPNPASNVVSLFFDRNYESKVEIFIFDTSGKRIKKLQKNITNNEIKLDISSLAKGIYFVNTRLGDKIKNTKLFVE